MLDILKAVIGAWAAGFLITLVALFVASHDQRFWVSWPAALKASALWFITLPLAGYIAWRLRTAPELLRRPLP